MVLTVDRGKHRMLTKGTPNVKEGFLKGLSASLGYRHIWKSQRDKSERKDWHFWQKHVPSLGGKIKSMMFLYSCK